MNTRNEKIEQSVVYWDETDIWDRRVEDLMECEDYHARMPRKGRTRAYHG